MDFQNNYLYPNYGKSPLPFFMTRPDYGREAEEEKLLRDMDYLQQSYPETVRIIMEQIAMVLDRMDYEGSMIYDEYPDRYSICSLSDSILQILKNAAKSEEKEWSKEHGEDMRRLVQVLLCDEIYKRRHGGRRSFLKF